MKRAIVGLLTAGLFLCAAATGSADEITIASGNVNVPSAIAGGNDAATFDLIGSGFEISGSMVGTVFACFPCSGGPQGIPISFTSSGTDFGTGLATFGGHNYGNVFFDGTFSAGGTAVLPILASGPFTVAFPFTVGANSHVGGFSDQLRNNSLFTTGLAGSGVATASFTPDPASPTTMFDLQTLKLNFASTAAAPTPEPMTVLLLASGLGLVARKLVRKPS